MDLFKVAFFCLYVVQHALIRLNLKERILDKKSSFENFGLESHGIVFFKNQATGSVFFHMVVN